MPQWEHLIIVAKKKNPDHSGDLSKWETVGGADIVQLGREGWEVVAVVPMKYQIETYAPFATQKSRSEMPTSFRGEMACIEVHTYLKRPKP